MAETWTTRELPVLKAVVELTDEGEDYLSPQQIADRTGMDVDTVQRALRALAANDPPFITVVDDSTLDGGRSIFEVHSPTGHARRTVGTWPSAETIAAGLVTALHDAADKDPDPDRKGRLRKAADAVGGLGKDVLANVIANVITRGGL